MANDHDMELPQNLYYGRVTQLSGTDDYVILFLQVQEKKARAASNNIFQFEGAPEGAKLF